MKQLLSDIKNCTLCEKHLPLGANPVMYAHEKAKIVIVGQAPGTKVHQTNLPWNDPSGDLLRKWLQLDREQFYDNPEIAIIPMGFCYPGKGKSGDLPPRPECAPLWHPQLDEKMPNVRFKLLIGQYAQKYYLGKERRRNLTETVRHYHEYLPDYFPLPHPSPRNRLWMRKNPWFDAEVVPALRNYLKEYHLLD